MNELIERKTSIFFDIKSGVSKQVLFQKENTKLRRYCQFKVSSILLFINFDFWERQQFQEKSLFQEYFQHFRKFLMFNFTQLHESTLTLSHQRRIPKKTTLQFSEFTETEASQTLSSFKKVQGFSLAETQKILPEFSSPSKTTRHSIISVDDYESDRKYFSGIGTDQQSDLEGTERDQLFSKNQDHSQLATLKIEKTTQRLTDGKKNIGAKEYLATLNILDPLGEQKIFSLKQKLIESTEGIFWDFSKFQENSFMFSPSAVLVPSLTFLLQLKLEELGQNSFRDLKFPDFSISLNQFQERRLRVEGIIDDLLLEIDCENIRNEEEKDKELQNLNYKVDQKLYRKSPLIKIQRLKLSSSTLMNSNEEKSKDEENLEAKKENEIVETLKTQLGSKNYQKQLKNICLSQLPEVVNNLSGHISQLIRNEYANYFIQELFPLLSQSLKHQILQELQLNFKESICSTHGTFVFQSFMDHFTGIEDYQIIVEGIRVNFSDLSLDSYGSHSIRKLIDKIPEELMICFFRNLEENLLKISQSKHGVCVVKNIFRRLRNSYMKQFEEEKERLFSIIKENLSEIISGQYSNYLIQQICETYPVQDCEELYREVAEKFYDFPINKFSAIILAKFLKQYWRSKPDYSRDVLMRLNAEKECRIESIKEGKKLLQELHEMEDEGKKNKKNDRYYNKSYKNRERPYNSRKYINS